MFLRSLPAVMGLWESAEVHDEDWDAAADVIDATVVAAADGMIHPLNSFSPQFWSPGDFRQDDASFWDWKCVMHEHDDDYFDDQIGPFFPFHFLDSSHPLIQPLTGSAPAPKTCPDVHSRDSPHCRYYCYCCYAYATCYSSSGHYCRWSPAYCCCCCCCHCCRCRFRNSCSRQVTSCCCCCGCCDCCWGWCQQSHSIGQQCHCLHQRAVCQRRDLTGANWAAGTRA